MRSDPRNTVQREPALSRTRFFVQAGHRALWLWLAQFALASLLTLCYAGFVALGDREAAEEFLLRQVDVLASPAGVEVVIFAYVVCFAGACRSLRKGPGA